MEEDRRGRDDETKAAEKREEERESALLFVQTI